MNSSIKSKTKMLQSSICDYSDAGISVKRIWTVFPKLAADRQSKQIILKIDGQSLTA